MVYNAAQTHVQAAFEVSREALALYKEDPAWLKPVVLTAGPLVDWRRRSVPKHRKRKAEDQPSKSPSAKRVRVVGQKRVNGGADASANGDADGAETDSGDDDDSDYRQQRVQATHG